MKKPTLERRKVEYATLEEFLADAERLVQARARTVGNWTLAQILGHLAYAIEKSIDGVPGTVPWYVRFVGRYILKPRILKHGMKPGFKLPAEAEKKAVPAADSDVSAALERLRAAIRRVQSDPTRVPHPIFGPLSVEEWNRLHRRHAEMHMSFIADDSAR